MPVETNCKDSKCPLHGELKTRGRTFKGRVVSTKMARTATVEWERLHYVPKFERYETRRTRVKAHNPECIDAEEGELVVIQECRPLSKTKSFAIIKKVEEVKK